MGPSSKHNRNNDKVLWEPVVGWLGFWVFLFLGLAILGGVALSPLVLAHYRLKGEYDLVIQQSKDLTDRLETLDHRIAALEGDPQYMERISRRELNLRKPGVETLSIVPQPVPSTGPARPQFAPPYADQRWFRTLLDASYRPWLVGLGVGLLFAAVMVSAGRRRPG